jgi:hypothetical protein
MPRIGRGLAGGRRERIERLLHEHLASRSVPVTMYGLP